MDRRVIIRGFICLAACCAVGLRSRAEEENLAFIRPVPRTSWAAPSQTLSCGTNAFVLTKRPTDKTAFASLLSPFFPAYTASEKVRVSFDYRGGTKGMALVSYLKPMEKGPLSAPVYAQRPFAPSAEWTSFASEVVLPSYDFMNHRFGVEINGGEGVLEVRNVRIEECAPARREGTPFVVGGKPVCEVAILASDDICRHENELRAARMFRYVLHRNGGAYLPVRTVGDVSEIGPNAVLIGAAAVAAGVVSAADEFAHQGRDGRQCFDGGCVRRTKGTRLGIVGGFPTGPQYGVYRLFRALGAEYLGAGLWRHRDPSLPFVAPADDEDFTPAVAFRLSHYNGRGGTMPELRGRTIFERLMCDFSYGMPGRRHIGVDHSMAKAIVPPREFGRSRPDFFAVNAKGERQGEGTSPQYIQYCLSNPDLAKLVGERMVELMRANPCALLFPISPGDGADNDCKCARCKALGSTSDVWLTFFNRVAEVTSREFPWKYLHMSSYVDTPEAPRSDVKPHPNVTADYCIYPRDYWPSCLLWDHWSNDEGRKAIAGWRRLFPRMPVVYYPMQCSEWMNIWPSFDMDVAVVRDFARARAHYTRYFGLAPQHGTSSPQMGCFANLRIFVVGRLEEDPETDVEPLVDDFMREFYGPAARPMRAYFDLLRGESARRQWLENCELRRRGFVTPELGVRCLALLDEAEAIASEPGLRSRVLREKQALLWSYLTDVSIGRANVPAGERSAWLGRLAEFCRVARETGATHMGSVNVRRWFHDVAYITFPKGTDFGRWADLPEVEMLSKDPARALAKLVGNGQTFTNGAYVVTAEGVAGGDHCRASRKGSLSPTACCLRRVSNGKGVASTFFDLPPEGTGCTRLVICGIWNGHPLSPRMTVTVNGRTVFDGGEPFSGGGWKDFAVAIPEGVLKAGRNRVVIRNLTGDAVGKPAGRETMLAEQSCYWGWCDIEHLRLEEPR